jgi:hypothetical protein
VIRSGARRLFALIGLLVAGSALVAALLGLATGNGVARPIGLAYYAIGSLTALAGFALGSQGLLRPPRRNEPERRSVEEMRESRTIAALLMLVGVAVVVLGIAVDPNARLV